MVDQAVMEKPSSRHIREPKSLIRAVLHSRYDPTGMIRIKFTVIPPRRPAT